MNPLRFLRHRRLAAGPGLEVHPASRVWLRRGGSIESGRVEEHVELPDLKAQLSRLEVGRGTYAGDELLALGRWGRLSIGRYCSLASRITFVCGDGYHWPSRASTYPFPFRPPFEDLDAGAFYPRSAFGDTGVTLGHDVWVGQSATVLKGARVGDGAIVASYAVVTGDVPPYAIVAGNPATVKRLRHDEETIALLLKLKWWDWPEERIRVNAELFRLTGRALAERLKSL